MDVGGTNVRIARLIDEKLYEIETSPCRKYTGPEQVLSQYFFDHDLTDVNLCMAIASPSTVDIVEMINLDWKFSRQDLQLNLNLSSLAIINDFHAMSLAIPTLSNMEIIEIGNAEPEASKPIVVCGPGTGLGVGFLLPVEGRLIAVPGEGGHMDFAPNTKFERKIWKYFHKKYGHVSAERILSGPGLEELHQVIQDIDGKPVRLLSASEITRLATSNEEASCVKTLNQFCELLGSFSGSLALSVGAFGGVYICGGMVPKFIEFFMQSKFRNQFEDKGRYQSYNKRIPTYVVTAEHPGLRGAAQYLRQLTI
jgi:glucokinase